MDALAGRMADDGLEHVVNVTSRLEEATRTGLSHFFQVPVAPGDVDGEPEHS